MEETCPHGTFSFTTLGRTDFDFVKLPGGILRADEIDRAIQTFRGRIGAQFTMIYDEAPSERGSLPKLTLAVEATQDFDFNSFAREFERVLRIGPSRTLADAIQDGRMLPLHCTAYIAGSGKRRRLARADR